MEFNHEQVTVAVPGIPVAMVSGNEGFRFRECTKNQALGVGAYAVDGCNEFVPAGEEGTAKAWSCAACTCHRNFHRREPIVQNLHQPMVHHNHQTVVQQVNQNYQRPMHQIASSSAHHQLHLAQPSSGGGNADGGDDNRSRTRFRTTFTADQKARMLNFAEGIGWRMRKEQKAFIQQFCTEIGVDPKAFKVWMNNKRYTPGSSRKDKGKAPA